MVNVDSFSSGHRVWRSQTHAGEVQMKRAITGALVLSAVLAGGASAQTFTEAGDAGQKLGAAQNVQVASSGSVISAINGSLISGAQDADLFRIYISRPDLFSASTVNSYTMNGTSDGGLDTALFLFRSDGVALATNDDASGFYIQSTLPVGNSLYANLSPGYYLLGISNSGNEAINSAGQLLFAGYPGGDTTAVRGSASGLNPTTEADFDGQSYTTQGGLYQIGLTGVTSGPAAAVSAAPEPGGWVLMMLGVGAIGAALGRRRRILVDQRADLAAFG